MLATEGYGCLGGVAQFNRDLLEALDASPRVERVIVWPRHAPEPLTEKIPESVVYDRACAQGKAAYVYRTLRTIIDGISFDLVICGHLHLFPIAWLAAKRSGAQLALILYGVECWRPTGNPLTNLLVRAADHVVSVSRFTAERFREWSGTAPERSVILPCCVDLETMTPGEKPEALRRRYGLTSGPVLMTMGRLAPTERYKGIDEIIELMPRLLTRFPDLAYVIVGEGADRARLKEKAHALGVGDHVVFAGRIDEAEKADHFRLADVFAMPSNGEGFGIVLIEAAACGVTIVGSGVDGSREALLDGALGALVDPKNADELCGALSTALASRAPRRRIDKVETFGRPAFRARVANWVEHVAKAPPCQRAAS